METFARGSAAAIGPRCGAACAALWLMLLLAPGAAGAQTGYAKAPFREAPVALAQAASLERIAVAARALAAQDPGAADEDDEEAAGAEEGEGGPFADFALFQASLAAASPELERALASAIEDMVEASEAGGSAAEPARKVIDLAEAARGALPPADADESRAALMAGLLLDEGGVAEGYEEAVEGEALAYATGWFALQRVRALWEGLAGQATPAQAADVEATLAMLDGLFPTPAMPERLSPDPEQAEAPAQQLVALLESVADADLYPGRDLPEATTLVRDIAAEGCASLASGEAGVGVERLTIATAYYGQTVQDTLGVLAPDAGDAIAAHFEALEGGAPGDAAAACGSLLDALAAGRAALRP